MLRGVQETPTELSVASKAQASVLHIAADLLANTKIHQNVRYYYSGGSGGVQPLPKQLPNNILLYKIEIL